MHRTLSAAWFKSERSQSATEFALIAPVLLLILFGILDFGRGVYYLVTLDQAVNEGARVAIRAPTPPNLDYFAPNDLQVIKAVSAEAPALVLTAPANGCVNGPLPTAANPGIPANTGWMYITAPGGKAPSGTPASPANAPGGQAAAPATSSCQQVVPAGITPGQVNVPLQVTINFNFVPVTPLIGQLLAAGHPWILKSYAVYRTEY
jgi:Flp pilus assembly protein TadG